MTVTDDRFTKMRPFNAGAAPRIPARALPPGPRWPALLQSFALMRYRHQFIPWLHRRYGEQIPVTFVDGEQHDFWRVDAARLRAALV